MGCGTSSDEQAVWIGQKRSNLVKKTDNAPFSPERNPVAPTMTMERSFVLDRSILLRYISLEKEIWELDQKNVIKAYQVKKQELIELKNRLWTAQDTFDKNAFQVKLEKTEEGKEEKQTLQKVFVDSENVTADNDQGDETNLTNEQEDYLQGLNELEIAEKKLETAKQQVATLSAEVSSLEQTCSRLSELYSEQDDLLANIFEGNYSNEFEFQLETQLDLALQRKQSVSVAYYKWENARVLLHQAVKQLVQGIRRWQTVIKIREEGRHQQYPVATECRNSLLAAHENISNAHRYLSNINFPYMKRDELDTLQRALNHIYTDLRTVPRHQHALTCYLVTHRRSRALLQWFNNVINNTILKDLDLAMEKAKLLEHELRAERVQLIKEKIRKHGGKELDLDIELDNEGDDDVKQQTALTISEPTESNVNSDTTSEESGDGLTLDLDDIGDQDSSGVTNNKTADDSPIKPEELAPAPKPADIFGDIDELKKQHERDMEDLTHAREMNKARMDQGLQEKLRSRKSRRNRQTIHKEKPEPRSKLPCPLPDPAGTAERLTPIFGWNLDKRFTPYLQ